MKVLLAVDGSDCSANAVREVANRRWNEGTELKILAVAEGHIPQMIQDPFLFFDAARVTIREAVHERLSPFVEEMKTAISNSEFGQTLTIETEIREGKAKDEILEVADDWGADLVIVGSHGYGNLKRFALGSVSQAVAAHAPCSVEIVRQKKE